ncbi:hypothetical protein Q1695_007870 [Nippostrongylus brasiliensis]|nr:hypothetical protein Q1695_007870 [Nippostrongylus brasiliensis]
MLRLLVLAVYLTGWVTPCDYMLPREEDLGIAYVEYGDDEDSGNSSRTKRDANSWASIRIEIVYDDSVNWLSSQKRAMLEKLMISARDYFEGTLKVHRVNSIQMTPMCQGKKWFYRNGSTLCENDCEKRCGTATVPSATYFVQCLCKNGPCPTEQLWGDKMRHADFILFVSAKMRSCSDTTMAYAAHCLTDAKTGRPIAGFANICPRSFNEMVANEEQKWESVIRHELIHAFVFSESLFPQFKSAKKKKGALGLVPGVVESHTYRDWETASGVISHSVRMIVTPKVTDEARRWFNCPSLKGAEIENQGGPGTQGSHWEKRLFEHEAMSGVATQVYAISRLTLALFEDSGWYKPDYSYAQPMSWGRGLGCSFATKSCLTWMKTHRYDPYPFCTTYDDSRCSANRKAKVNCNMRVGGQKVPAPDYDYNVNGLYRNLDGDRIPYAYGGLVTADYCPYYRVVGEYSREGTDTRCTFVGNTNYVNYSLEVFSPSSRCFELKGGIKVVSGENSVTWMKANGCYERLTGVGTVSTRIICPSCAEICGASNCKEEVFVENRIGDPTRIRVGIRFSVHILSR